MGNTTKQISYLEEKAFYLLSEYKDDKNIPLGDWLKKFPIKKDTESAKPVEHKESQWGNLVRFTHEQALDYIEYLNKLIEILEKDNKQKWKSFEEWCDVKYPEMKLYNEYGRI